MTAIKKYQILEAKGLWIEAKGKAPKEVIVSIGKSSIIISDNNEVPLNHWNFNSIVVLHKNTKETIFSPGLERQEELLVQDEEMIKAMTIICEHGKIPKQPILKSTHVRKISVSFIIIIFFFSLPSLLRIIALDIIEPYHEPAFVRTILKKEDLIQNVCPKQRETEELENTVSRNFGVETGIDITVTKSPLTSPLILPGGMIIIPFNWLEQEASYQKFGKLLDLALSLFEERKVFTSFLKEQKLSTILGHILGLEVQFVLNLDNYYVTKNQQVRFKEALIHVSDHQWINIKNSCLN